MESESLINSIKKQTIPSILKLNIFVKTLRSIIKLWHITVSSRTGPSNHFKVQSSKL